MVKTTRFSIRQVSGLKVYYKDDEVYQICTPFPAEGNLVKTVPVPGLNASERSRRGHKPENYIKSTDDQKFDFRYRRRSF